jgi:Centromere protein Scm3
MYAAPLVDVQRERDASKLRLLDVWSSLAERHTRRLDEDDIVNIRTGKITTDRGFIRNSRKIDFGAIAAPAVGDVADEDTDEDEYDTDELDAFADTTSEVDNAELEQREMTLADAEDLRAFLEAERTRRDLYGSEVEDDDNAEDLCAFLDAERKRKDICGSEVEEDGYSTPDQDSRTALDSGSEDELDNWDVDESNAVYHLLQQKDNDSDIEIIEGPTPSPLKPTQTVVANKSQDQLQTPPSPNNTSTSNVRTPSIKPYVLLTPRKSTTFAKSKTEKQNFTPKLSISGSESESGSCYYYPRPHSPRRKQRHHPPPPENFVPPVPDPRAQFIITQAVQQLSALAGTWTRPHDSPFIPHTPPRPHQSRQANFTFNTPTYHPHPYPYSYNPNLSVATLPPESPESVFSPEKSLHKPRKSCMTRHHSRRRRVSFKIDDDELAHDDRGRGRVDVYTSPSKPPLRREAIWEQGLNFTKPSKGKGKARAEASDSESSSEDLLNSGSNRDEEPYLRGRTPGPKIGPPKGIKRRT